MNKKETESFVNRYGERWILRDIDFFPEKLTDMAMSYNYSWDLCVKITEGKGFSFDTEYDAVCASIKIYKLLGKDIPVDLMRKYFEWFK